MTKTTKMILVVFCGWMSTATFASGLLTYPIQIDFGSQQVCDTAAQSLEISPTQADSSLSIKCKGSTLVGTIDASPGRSSLPLRIVWPTTVDTSCDQVMGIIQKTKPITQTSCKDLPYFSRLTGNKWLAIFSYPLVGGKDFDEIQREKIANIQNWKNSRDAEEDRRFCEKSAQSGHPCRWLKEDSNPAVSNVKNSTKEAPAIGGSSPGGASTRSGNTLPTGD